MNRLIRTDSRIGQFEPILDGDGRRLGGVDGYGAKGQQGQQWGGTAGRGRLGGGVGMGKGWRVGRIGRLAEVKDGWHRRERRGKEIKDGILVIKS